MAKSAQRLTIFGFLVVLFLFTAIAPAYGRGSKESDLNRADALINEKRYDEAILILSDYARRNPEQFDQTQRRFNRIYEIQDEFNRVADELIDTIMNTPEDDPKILRLTTRLYQLEHEDSPIMVNFVARAREIARFNINRNLLRNILDRGRFFLDMGNSVAALQAYAEGMNFMREEFFSSGYGDYIENEVRRETERVHSMVAAFQQASTQMGTIAAEYTRAVNAGNLGQIPEITNRLVPAMDRFIALKQNLYTSASVFDRTLNQIQETNPEMLDRNHLSFVSLVVHGRPEASIQEGMFGAFDTHWNNTIGGILTAIATHAERGKNSSIASINSADYRSVASTLDRIDNYINLTPLFFNKTQELFAGANLQTISLYGTNILLADIPTYLELMALIQANNFLLQASNTALRLNVDRSSLVRWQEGRISTDAALRSEQQARNTITELLRDIDTIKTNANRINDEINVYHQVTHITDAIRAIDTIQANLNAEDLQSAQRYYAIAQHSLDNILAERRAQLDSGISLLDGQVHTDDEGLSVTYHFPSEALDELTTMLAASSGDMDNEQSVFSQFLNETTAIADSPEVAHLQTTINELINIHTQGVTLSETARTRSGQAEALRQEGDRNFREAQAAYNRQDYEAARDFITRADRNYSQSLEIQESPSLRQMRDSQFMHLAQLIRTAENERILVEVRQLIDNARDQYYGGEFQQAENSLTRARSSWSIASPGEDHEEIMMWLGIVRTALSATSGRVIPPTAPLYAEMSQLLSQAQRNYEDGVRLINAGQRTQGIARFGEAQVLTREVKLLFPINQEAGLIDLRIEQFTDRAAFDRAFEQRLRTAIAGTERRSMDAFADLQNLAQLNPNYPNIRQIIITAEIAMGIRPPPISPADIARSRDLTASARRIIDSNTTAQYQAALNDLTAAIRLDRDNTEASRLRDILVRRIQTPTNLVLSAQDEASYQQALSAFQAGNNLTALTIVNRLLQNTANRTVTKLVELQRRIQQASL
ncbi:MAG: hypothetical protein FWD47_03755 [Treponema sp.]|nr:hypothetical protein [Treponema sp.]